MGLRSGMTSTLRALAPPAWVGASLGGLSYLVLHLLIETWFPDHWSGSPDRLLGWSYAAWSRLLWLPPALLLFGLAGIYRRLSTAIGRIGQAGFGVAAAGLGLDMFGSILEFWIVGVLLVPWVGEFRTGSPGSQLGYQTASFGALLLLVGLVLIGFAGLRARQQARWRFLPMVLGLSYVSALPFYFLNRFALHAVLYGLSWMWAGYFLWKENLERPG